MNRRRLVGSLLLALVLAVVTACSSGTSRPTAGPSTSPTSAPTSNPGRTGTPAAAGPRPGKLSSWHGCGGGFQCATLTVQLDDHRPALGTVDLALLRHKATGSHRIGSLITDPGGPGDSAVAWLRDAYAHGEFPSEVTARFDLVAFDPRGVGQSAPVRCESTSQLDAYFHLDPAPATPAARAAYLAGNQRFDVGCGRRSARILPYVNTVVVAQDMDRVRQAVGDTKLTYLGYSYGTAIGASYLAQFPTRVRAMVLDGAIDPTITWDQFLAGQSGGFDLAFSAFLADCQRTHCAFRDAVSGDLGAAFDALAARVTKRDLPGDGSRTVGPGEFTTGVELGLYNKSFWPAIGEALADAEHGDGRYLLQLSDAYLERSSGGYSNLIEAETAVNCVDRPWPRAEAPYYALAAQVAKTAPRFGPGIALSGMSCIAWPIPASSRPHAVHAPGSPAVVVIGTTRDPATPYAWAVGLAKQLSHGVLITHVGDGHTVYRDGAPDCIVNPVDAYLISLLVPSASICSG